IMRPKVLIVDDDPINIELLEGYLSKEYDILKAHDGNEAIIIVEANPPDIILLDIMMPGMNGYEVCKKLKMIIKPIIYLSLWLQLCMKQRIGIKQLKQEQMIFCLLYTSPSPRD